MVLQDKYKRAASAKYRAKHGGLLSNRQAAAGKSHLDRFPSLEVEAPDLKASPSQEGSADEESPSDGQGTAKEGPTPSFATRMLRTNAHRYDEPEPEPDAEPEPEVDLTTFLDRQRQAQPALPSDEESDVDESFAHLRLGGKPRPKPAGTISADDAALLAMDEERKKADAARALRARFTGNARAEVSASRLSRLAKDGPPTDAQPPPMDDEDFLDEVLADSSGTFGKTRRK